jgi:multidrug transporter EmrE-like cation transporter
MAMGKPALAVVITILLSLTAVVADYFLKRAADLPNSFRTPWFLVGLIVYASTAFGTVFVFQHIKLAIAGVVYSVSFTLFLTLLGILFFNEGLELGEAVGIAMALASLMLLGRFL